MIYRFCIEKKVNGLFTEEVNIQRFNFIGCYIEEFERLRLYYKNHLTMKSLRFNVLILLVVISKMNLKDYVFTYKNHLTMKSLRFYLEKL